MAIRRPKRSTWAGTAVWLACVVLPKHACADSSTDPAAVEPKSSKITQDAPAAPSPPSARLIDDDVEKKAVPSEAAPNSSSPTVGYVLLGAGVVGLTVGSYFALHAFSEWSTRNDGCTNGCSREAKSAGDKARTAALVSELGFGVGLLAAGVGTYLILSSKPARHTAQSSLQLLPMLGSSAGGLWLRGEY